MSARKPLAPLRAVAYARYSSEQQRAARIEDQLRNCRRHADDEGWAVLREEDGLWAAYHVQPAG